MPSDRVRSAGHIVLTAPVIFLVLAATAIPIELRPLKEAELSFSVDDVSDIIANIIGYLPVGIVLGGLGNWRAVFIAGLISMFAETSQLFILHRDPSIVDVGSNIVGATLGSSVSARWNIRSLVFRVTRSKAVLAILLALLLVAGVWFGTWRPY